VTAEVTLQGASNAPSWTAPHYASSVPRQQATIPWNRPLRVRLAVATAVLAITVVTLGDSASAGAPSTVELGAPSIATEPSCPEDPCLAILRTTGFQDSDGISPSPMKVPLRGKLVAWSTTLARPNPAQIAFFTAAAGGEPEADVAILRPEPQPRNWATYRLVASSPPVKLEPFFGQTAHFTLAAPLTVREGDVVALTVPTWAPSLATGLGKDVDWLASRPEGTCSDTHRQTSQTLIGSSAAYGCVYQTGRLTYGATLAGRVSGAGGFEEAGVASALS
jgi:hypothetical protein